MVRLELLTPADKVFRNKDAQEIVIAAPKHLAHCKVCSHVTVQQVCRKECGGKHCEPNESKQEDVVSKLGTYKIGIPPQTVALCISSRFSQSKCHSAPKSSCVSCGHLGQCAQCIAKNKAYDEQGSLLAVDPCCLH